MALCHMISVQRDDCGVNPAQPRFPLFLLSIDGVVQQQLMQGVSDIGKYTEMTVYSPGLLPVGLRFIVLTACKSKL